MPVRPSAAETNLYSEGAEFLVLGQLLIRGIHATKAYTRFPGWDLLATNPGSGVTCRLQVKARLATDFDGGFPIKTFNAEFVILVALNRGNRYRKTTNSSATVKDPVFWILPMDVILDASQTASKWGDSSKVFLRKLENSDQYLSAWHLIADSLEIT